VYRGRGGRNAEGKCAGRLYAQDDYKPRYNKFKNEFSFVKDRITKYYNINRMKKPSFKKRNKIYLFYKNIIIKRLNDKLDFKKFKPFIIIRKILEYNYKLSLFKTI